MTYKERIQKLISNKFGDTGARLQVATLMEEINLNFYKNVQCCSSNDCNWGFPLVKDEIMSSAEDDLNMPENSRFLDISGMKRLKFKN